MTRRPVLAVAAAAVLAGALVAGWSAGGTARAAGFTGAFSSTAAADGMRQSVIVPGAPLTASVVDIGAPSVQASLDSLGNSQAFASLPYPGETIATGSGLVRTLSGLPAPDYPLYVHSSHPIVPQQEVGAGAYHIKAESAEGGSKATASSGLAAPNTAAVGLVRTEAATVAADGSVTADAVSDVESFTVGPLRLGQILSTARVTLDGNGKRSSQADTRLVVATVGDTAVALTGGGLTVAGTNQPLPALDGVTAALAAAGITVELMPRQDQPTGVVAPAVRITQRQTSGTQLVYLLGGASAFADGAGATLPAPAAPPQPPDIGPGPNAPAGDSGAAAGLPVSPGETSADPLNGETGPLTGSRAATAAGPFTTGEAQGPPSTSGALPPAVAAPAGESPSATPLPTPDGEAAHRLASQLLGLSADAGPLYGALAIGGLIGLAAVGAALVRRGVSR